MKLFAWIQLTLVLVVTAGTVAYDRGHRAGLEYYASEIEPRRVSAAQRRGQEEGCFACDEVLQDVLNVYDAEITDCEVYAGGELILECETECVGTTELKPVAGGLSL
jgi:hypothetical protein